MLTAHLAGCWNAEVLLSDDYYAFNLHDWFRPPAIYDDAEYWSAWYEFCAGLQLRHVLLFGYIDCR